jgi:23S rRNA (pseudouridine1915-N3)-methyltransferase
MTIRILSVGKKHDQALSAAIDEYSVRTARIIKLDWEFVPPSGLPEQQARLDESERLLQRVREDIVWLLDERGVQVDSPALSTKLTDLQMNGVKQLTIVIGGAYGVSKRMHERADFTWSLSKLVFPHQLVRLILAEQLYRATEIARGSGYHHV